MEKKRKWSKLSIIAFVCLIFPLLSIPLNFLLQNSVFSSLSYLSSLSFLASLVLAIISLIKIKKYNLKGRWLAIVTIILWILAVISIMVILGLALANCGKKYYFEVPMTINVGGTNYQMEQIDNPSKDPEILLLTFDLGLDTALNKCGLDSFLFSIKSSPQVIYADFEGKDYVSKGFYDGPGGSYSLLIENYSGSGSKNYTLHLKEPWGMFWPIKKTENLLRLNREEFYLEYTLKPFYSQKAPISGGGREKQVAYGCFIIDRRIYNDTSMLKITGTKDKINLNPTRILCVKPYKMVNGRIDISNNNCTFFELTSEIEINYNIDLDKGENKVYHQPCL